MKIKYSTKVYTNKDAVTVVVTPEFNGEYLWKYLYIANKIKSTGIENKFCDKMNFKGIARYKGGDEYDLTLATRIARKKAIRQAEKYFLSIMKAYKANLEYGLSDVEKQIKAFNKRIDELTKEIIE